MLEKRSLSLSGHRTSIALEPEFWAALEALAAGEGLATAALVTRIDAGRTPEQPLTSALRVYALSKRSLF
jgi:predicted DNA-binding ribbon-helix-helix protein